MIKQLCYTHQSDVNEKNKHVLQVVVVLTTWKQSVSYIVVVQIICRQTRAFFLSWMMLQLRK